MIEPTHARIPTVPITLNLSKELVETAVELAHERMMGFERFLVDVIDSYCASQRLEKMEELRNQPVRLPGNVPE